MLLIDRKYTLALWLVLAPCPGGRAAEPAKTLPMPDTEAKRELKPCRLTPEDAPDPAVKVLPSDKKAGPVFLTGGGYAPDLVESTAAFKKLLERKIDAGARASLPFLFGASKLKDLEDAKFKEGIEGYLAGWQKDLGDRAVVRPVFPGDQDSAPITLNGRQIATNPDDADALAAIREAPSVMMMGGWVREYQKLVGRKLNDAMKESSRKGGVMYGSSAGTNTAGLIDGGYIQAFQRGDKKLRPEVRPGFGLVNATFVSHIDDPRILKGMGFEKNPYASIQTLNRLVFDQEKRLDHPVFGIPVRSWVQIEKGILAAHGEPDKKIHVFDPRHKPDGVACDYYYLSPGDRYDLDSGRVLSTGGGATAAPAAAAPEHG